jgi:DNA-binding NarL/FixJ family response regulator
VQTLVRAWLRALLEKLLQVEIVAEASDGRDAFDGRDALRL